MVLVSDRMAFIRNVASTFWYVLIYIFAVCYDLSLGVERQKIYFPNIIFIFRKKILIFDSADNFFFGFTLNTNIWFRMCLSLFLHYAS